MFGGAERRPPSAAPGGPVSGRAADRLALAAGAEGRPPPPHGGAAAGGHREDRPGAGREELPQRADPGLRPQAVHVGPGAVERGAPDAAALPGEREAAGGVIYIYIYIYDIYIYIYISYM